MTEASAIDYGASYLFFRDSPAEHGVNHTPRALIDACCTLTAPGEASKTYYLGCPCATEQMYASTGLIHEPMAEFRSGMLTQGDQGGCPAPLASGLHRIPIHSLLNLHGI